MSIEEVRKKAEGLAYEYEQKYGGCSQCVLGGIRDSVGGISDDVFKSATGLAGGIGLKGSTCGALSGGVIALSSYLGREYINFPDPTSIRHKSFELARELIKKFEEEYGSIICKDIQTRLMGRSFNLLDEEDRDAFNKAGGHEDKCPSVCGKSAGWVIEILHGKEFL